MGDDFRNRQVYVRDQEQARVVAVVRAHLFGLGYVPTDEVKSGRGIAICRTEHWVTVLDSAEIDAFHQLTVFLSAAWPVVEVEMSDSAAVTLSLYVGGARVDQFQNLKPPFFPFASPEEAAEVNGKPQLWSQFFTVSPTALRALWQQGRDSKATTILSETGALLGWHPLLCEAGYTIEYDGLPITFEEHYSDVLEQLPEREYLHFQRRDE